MAFTQQDKQFMQHALSLARQAAESAEVPVGAVLVSEGNIIGQGSNNPLKSNDPTAHAEILALRDAGRQVGNYRFPGSILYVTLEPCVMCAGALVHARVQKVIYAAPDPRVGAASCFHLLPSGPPFNHRLEIEGGLMSDEAAALLKEFFRLRR